MRTTSGRRNLFGKLAFFVPLIIIVSIVLYAFFQVTSPGSLEVDALVHDKYLHTSSQGSPVQVSIQVSYATGGSSKSGTTPVTLSLPPGTYTVAYATVNGYFRPTDRSVSVDSGIKSYAVGVYEAIPIFISITSVGFNSTAVSALNSVTPVIWINNSGSPLTLQLGSSGEYYLYPGQNHTQLFQATGSTHFSIGTNVTGTVVVS